MRRESKHCAGSAIYLTRLLSSRLFFLTPIYVVIVTSFKGLDELRRGDMLALPEVWSLAAWLKAWSGACTGTACDGLRPFFINSVHDGDPVGRLLGADRIVQRVCARPMAFSRSGCDLHAFAVRLLYSLPGDPASGRAVSRTCSACRTRYPGLVVIHVGYGIAFTTMLFRNFYVNVPAELVKAARVDGAGFFLIYRRDFPAALRADLHGLRHLAIHPDLERFPVRCRVLRSERSPCDGWLEQPGEYVRRGQGV